MQWFDWHNAARMPQTPFGPTAVVGVTTIAGVPALRARYDFRRVEALRAQLRADRVQALGRSRSACSRMRRGRR